MYLILEKWSTKWKPTTLEQIGRKSNKTLKSDNKISARRYPTHSDTVFLIYKPTSRLKAYIRMA